MSGRRDDSNEALRKALMIGTAGAGAAALGYMLWNDFQRSSSPSSPQRPPLSGESNVTASKKKTDSFQEKIPKAKCGVCHVYREKVSMLPCGHIKMCEDCTEKSKCPTCEKSSRNRWIQKINDGASAIVVWAFLLMLLLISKIVDNIETVPQARKYNHSLITLSHVTPIPLPCVKVASNTSALSGQKAPVPISSIV